MSPMHVRCRRDLMQMCKALSLIDHEPEAQNRQSINQWSTSYQYMTNTSLYTVCDFMASEIGHKRLALITFTVFIYDRRDWP